MKEKAAADGDGFGDVFEPPVIPPTPVPPVEGEEGYVDPYVTPPPSPEIAQELDYQDATGGMGMFTVDRERQMHEGLPDGAVLSNGRLSRRYQNNPLIQQRWRENLQGMGVQAPDAFVPKAMSDGDIAALAQQRATEGGAGYQSYDALHNQSAEAFNARNNAANAPVELSNALYDQSTAPGGMMGMPSDSQLDMLREGTGLSGPYTERERNDGFRSLQGSADQMLQQQKMDERGAAWDAQVNPVSNMRGQGMGQQSYESLSPQQRKYLADQVRSGNAAALIAQDPANADLLRRSYEAVYPFKPQATGYYNNGKPVMSAPPQMPAPYQGGYTKLSPVPAGTTYAGSVLPKPPAAAPIPKPGPNGMMPKGWQPQGVDDSKILSRTTRYTPGPPPTYGKPPALPKPPQPFKPPGYGA